MNENSVRLLYRFLGHKGFKSRLGSLDYTTKVYENYFASNEEEVIAYARLWDGKRNVFIGRNPRNPDGSIHHSSVVSFDIDPVRPKDSAASTEQHTLALDAGRNLLSHYPGGFLASSGNGALLLYPWTSINADRLEEHYRKEKVLIDEFQALIGPGLKVDNTNYGEAVIKAIGTMSTKGDPALRRCSCWIKPPYIGAPKPAKLIAKLSSILVARPPSAMPSGDPIKRITEAKYFLAKLNPKRVDDYNEWLKVGMVLKEFGIAGLSLWKDWSRQSEKYDEKICEEKWRSLDEIPRVTVSTLAFLAKEDGGSNPVSVGVSDDYFTGLFTHDEEGDCNRIATGFPNLDKALGTLPRGELVTFAARSGFGKTTFACTVAEFLRRSGKKVLYFSTEMSARYLMHKLVAVATSTPLAKFLDKYFSDDEKLRIRAYQQELLSAPIIICDEFKPSLAQVHTLCEEHKPDVIIFDHITHVDTNWQGVAEYIKELKALTAEHKAVTLVMSMLNEPPRTKDGGEQTSLRSDVRGSQEIIYLSSIFAFFNNPYDVKTELQPVECHIAKNRYGISGVVVPLIVDKVISRFMEAPSL